MKKIERLGRRLFRLKTEELELDEEVRFHIEMLTEEFKATGLNEDEARKAALKEFGNVESTLEACRTSWWGFRLLDDLLQDTRFGLHQMWKHKGFTFVSIITLAVCLAVNAMVYFALHSVVVAPQGLKDVNRVVKVSQEDGRRFYAPLLVNEYEFVEQHAESFAYIGAQKADDADLYVNGGVQRVRCCYVTPDLWRVWGVAPQVGRFFSQADLDASSKVAVINHRIWSTIFDSNPDLSGLTIRMNESDVYAVIGVMPSLFQAADDVCVPWSFSGEERRSDRRGCRVTARLMDDISLGQVDDELSRLQVSFVEQADAEYRERFDSKEISGFHAELLHADKASSFHIGLYAVQLVALFVLIIGCLNICGMMLARSYARQGEFAMRRAMGAGIFRIARQVTTEIAALFGAGAVVALLLIQGIIVCLPKGEDGTADGDVMVILFSVTLALTLISALLTSIFPLLELFRNNLSRQLSSVGRAIGGRAKKHRFRTFFSFCQIMLSVVLVVCAVAVAGNAIQYLRKDLGYERKGFVSVQVDLPEYRFGNFEESLERQLPVRKAISEHLRHVPGVVGVARGELSLIARSSSKDAVKIPGQKNRKVRAHQTLISAGYFKLLKIPLIGREFGDADIEGSGLKVIINQRMAATCFHDKDPLGRKIKFDGRWHEIVGVCGDVRVGLGIGEITEAIYTCDAQKRSFGTITFLVQVEGDTEQYMEPLRQSIQAYDPYLPTTMRDLDNGFLQAVFAALMVMYITGGSALMALFLTVIGLYGLLSHSVAERTKEFGIRLALGEPRMRVAGRVMKSSGVLAIAGLALGLAGTHLICSKVNPLLTEFDATRPGLFVSVGLFMLFVILAATAVPTLRAVNTNIAQALRDE